MENNMEFKVEVTSVKAAKARVAEIREVFGEDVFIKVVIGGEAKGQVFSTLNDAIKEPAQEIKQKLRRDKE